eukprot:m.526566 g.526566  ORF g.526566 m.526566 type:complete len:331 (+) comp57550_c0_seq12:15-1007(+)
MLAHKTEPHTILAFVLTTVWIVAVVCEKYPPPTADENGNVTYLELPHWYWPVLIISGVLGLELQFLAYQTIILPKVAKLQAKAERGERVTVNDVTYSAMWLRWLKTAMHWVHHVPGPIIGLYYGFWPAFGFMLLGMFQLVIALDLFSADSTALNLIILKSNGFSPLNIVFCITVTQLMASLGTAVMSGYHCAGAVPYASPGLLLKVIAGLVIGEFTAMPLHRWMHRNETLARVHLMHHCCRASGVFAAIIFHPLDLLFEFSGPQIGVQVFALYFLEDKWALICIAGISMSIWYCISTFSFLISVCPFTLLSALCTSRFRVDCLFVSCLFV